MEQEYDYTMVQYVKYIRKKNKLPTSLSQLVSSQKSFFLMFILYVNLDDQLHTVLLLEYIRPPQLK